MPKKLTQEDNRSRRAVGAIGGGALEGEGSLTGSVIVQNGGILSPGMGGDDTGLLSIGNLDMQAGSTSKSDINGPLFDQVRVSGNITLIANGVLKPGMAPVMMSSRLGSTADVMATESPSQLSPDVSQMT